MFRPSKTPYRINARILGASDSAEFALKRAAHFQFFSGPPSFPRRAVACQTHPEHNCVKIQQIRVAVSSTVCGIVRVCVPPRTRFPQRNVAAKRQRQMSRAKGESLSFFRAHDSSSFWASTCFARRGFKSTHVRREKTTVPALNSRDLCPHLPVPCFRARDALVSAEKRIQLCGKADRKPLSTCLKQAHAVFAWFDGRGYFRVHE